MRIFFFLIIISNLSYAQLDTGSGTLPCDNTTFGTPSPNNTYECSSVTITAPFSTADLADPSLPLIIKSSSDVTIGEISFQGLNGMTATPFAFGGDPGPGGGIGGSFIGAVENGFPAPHGGNSAQDSSFCPDPLTDTAEGSGGGGGSFKDLGQDGVTGNELVGNGIIVPAGSKGTPINFSTYLLAGSGGGSGGNGCQLPDGDSNQAPGSGGGGGGGIHIIANGEVTITGTIDVSGGNGGNGNNLGGGGGGGSAGFIIIQTNSQINLTGALIASGGIGGTNGSPTTAGNGGLGAQGVVILEDIDGNVPGTIVGTTPDIRPVGGSPISNVANFKSDISCGTILPKNNDSKMFFQMLTGFFIVMMMSALLKTLSRFPKKF